MGASAREMKALLLDAAQNPEFHCLSPLAVFREFEEFIKRVTENEFLKQEVKTDTTIAQNLFKSSALIPEPCGQGSS
jgi:hypothetical protein